MVMPTEYLTFLRFSKLHPEAPQCLFSKTKARWLNCSFCPALRPVKKLQDVFFVCSTCAGTSSEVVSAVLSRSESNFLSSEQTKRWREMNQAVLSPISRCGLFPTLTSFSDSFNQYLFQVSRMDKRACTNQFCQVANSHHTISSWMGSRFWAICCGKAGLSRIWPKVCWIWLE